MAWMTDRNSRKNQDEGESALKRLNRVLATATTVTDADPDEVEARLRNMSHGTKRRLATPQDRADTQPRPYRHICATRGAAHMRVRAGSWARALVCADYRVRG